MDEKISLYDILEVNELDTEETKSYYSKKDGCMVVISEEDLEFVKAKEDINILEEWKREMVIQAKDFLENPDDYLEFPKEEDYNEENIMIHFIKSLKEDEENYNKLKGAIRHDVSIKAFKEELFSIGLSDEWYDFREEKFLEIAREWCIKNNVEYTEE